MSKTKQNVINFLGKYKMDHLDVDIDINVKNFIKEMQQALTDKKSSMKMIPTYLGIDTDVPANKRVIVADATEVRAVLE